MAVLAPLARIRNLVKERGQATETKINLRCRRSANE
jgi:hypothetical protein